MSAWGMVAGTGPGRVRISDRVVTSIALLACSEVAGTVELASTLGRLTGNELPLARAWVAGDRTRVSVDIAVAWPNPLPRVTATVRDVVGSRIRELTGLRVDGVDVTATAVVHPEELEPAERVR